MYAFYSTHIAQSLIHRNAIVVLLIELTSITKRLLSTNVHAEIVGKYSLYSLWIKDEANRNKIKAIHRKQLHFGTRIESEANTHKAELRRINEDNAETINRIM